MEQHKIKTIIIGLHDSGKQEIREFMKNQGLVACRKFSSDPEAYDDYFEPITVKEIFDNNSYLYVDTFFEKQSDVFVGATLNDYDNCDFITLSPREFMQIPANRNLGEVVIIWVDNTRSRRFEHWKSKKECTDFNAQEEFEKAGTSNLINYIYKFPNSHVLYFNNEEAERIAAIATAVSKVPELIPIFEKTFK